MNGWWKEIRTEEEEEEVGGKYEHAMCACGR